MENNEFEFEYDFDKFKKKYKGDNLIYDYIYSKKWVQSVHGCMSFIKHKDSSLEDYDIIVEIQLKLMRALNNNSEYKPTLQHINRALQDMCKRYATNKRKIESIININEIEEYIGVDNLNENSILLESYLKCLTSDEKELLYMYFYKGYTYDEITKYISIKTKRGVKKKLDTILNKVRNNI